MNKIIAIILMLLIPSVLWSATYYVDDSAANDTGDGSSGSPKKYIMSGINLMTGTDDILIIKDGTYTNSSDQITSVQSGSAGHYKTIKAENDGGAVISLTDGLALTSGTDAYVQFEGLKFSHGSGKTVAGNHLKFLRCSFQGGGASGNTVNTQVQASYILFEDCWFYGSGGRYNLLFYLSDHIIARRCVLRHDGGWTSDGNPEAGFNSYSSSYVYFQNCIAIDCDGTYANWYSLFYATEHAGSQAHNHWDGCIALKGLNQGFLIDPTTNVDAYINNCVSYDMEVACTFNNGGTDSGSANNTLGDAGTGVSAGFNHSNSILFNATSTFYSGTGSYCDNEGGGGSCTNCQTYDPQTNGLLYLPRIESASALSTAGSGGGVVGATITKKIGTSGTLYGDTGWNTTTTDDLWPWPYEARIKTDMAAVSTRGFCTASNDAYGQPQTLTRYIWQYLGNEIPADIYGEEADTTPPTVTSATINSAGTTLTFAMSESVTNNFTTTVPTLSMSGGAVTATCNSCSSGTSLTYTLSRTVYSGETGTYSWDVAANGVEDAAGNDLVDISGASVTNSSSQVLTSSRNIVGTIIRNGAMR